MSKSKTQEVSGRNTGTHAYLAQKDHFPKQLSGQQQQLLPPVPDHQSSRSWPMSTGISIHKTEQVMQLLNS
jgi:hypothetical protein